MVPLPFVHMQAPIFLKGTPPARADMRRLRGARVHSTWGKQPLRQGLAGRNCPVACLLLLQSSVVVHRSLSVCAGHTCWGRCSRCGSGFGVALLWAEGEQGMQGGAPRCTSAGLVFVFGPGYEQIA